MSLSDLPRGYDRYVTRGPSERDIEAETERRNERDDRRYHARKDDEDRERSERERR